MICEILICTIDEGINRTPEVLMEPLEGVRYVVSHQLSDGRSREIPEALRRKDVLVTQLLGRGLARNRNHALGQATGDIVLLADDDARYRPQYLESVREVFSAARAPDVACFMIATPAGDPAYKDYAAEPYRLNEESRHYISSLEIAFRRDRVADKAILFDERFGLGSELVQSGEEAVFIHDCVRASLAVQFYPRFIAEHGSSSKTKNAAPYAEQRNIFKGAYDARRYGWLAIPAALLDTCRLRRDIQSRDISRKQYLKQRLRGAWYILRG